LPINFAFLWCWDKKLAEAIMPVSCLIKVAPSHMLKMKNPLGDLPLHCACRVYHFDTLNRSGGARFWHPRNYYRAEQVAELDVLDVLISAYPESIAVKMEILNCHQITYVRKFHQIICR
jgi:hypothetical protein